ncbi:CRISPR system precrRNA processing endoribonuclease RAMP protein Cas6 [Neisseria cinerea]|uniref:CRISPR system precrRNA processing endoribonuclease RAMP protein Cas6 n=1 Tax=Neisseria cinerea TaxID=483 RepID=UPI0009D70BB6
MLSRTRPYPVGYAPADTAKRKGFARNRTDARNLPAPAHAPLPDACQASLASRYRFRRTFSTNQRFKPAAAAFMARVQPLFQPAKTKTPLGGVVGTWELTRLSPAFSQMLYIGQWLHLGKETVFGNGQYRIIRAG